MKALARRKAGGPETLVLEELPEPVVGPDQVRIAVRACAVNFPARILPPGGQEPHVAGSERDDYRRTNRTLDHRPRSLRRREQPSDARIRVLSQRRTGRSQRC
jgi:hypothetical protein